MAADWARHGAPLLQPSHVVNLSSNHLDSIPYIESQPAHSPAWPPEPFNLPFVANLSDDYFDFRFLNWTARDNASDGGCNQTTCVEGGNTTVGPQVASTYYYWALCLLVFPLLTVFGNVLVVMSVYREKSLHTVTNYFIVSLAIADILVAAVVMPPAVYLEVTNGVWGLSDILCDAWISFDVLASTASILNLTAISVDRFIAVTMPIKYAKHRSSKRVSLMMTMAWLVSIAISFPIMMGLNVSPERIEGMCTFNNPDFVIYSSMGSFYIPCIMMFILYYKIFKTIRIRAQKQVKRQHQGRRVSKSTGGSQPASGRADSQRELVATPRSNQYPSVALSVPDDAAGEVSCELDDMNVGAGLENSGSSDTVRGSSVVRDKSQELALALAETDEADPAGHRLVSQRSCQPIEEETAFTIHSSEAPSGEGPNWDRSPRRLPTVSEPLPEEPAEPNKKVLTMKTVMALKFNLRQASKKKRLNAAARRERKATKTLVIVLGVFLLCWMPFFTCHNANAICSKLKLECHIPPLLMGTFLWLGYINSFFNPVIYTIFNIEFRKAFKKILTEPCPR